MSLIEAPDLKKKGIYNIVDFSKRHKIYDMVYKLSQIGIACIHGNDKCWKGYFFVIVF